MNKLARRIAIPAVLGVLVTVIALSLAPAESALAAPKTVTLDVPGMTCASCPITVKMALTKVEGVEKAEVSFEKKEAVVTFDDAKTKIEALTEATKNAGYPSTVKN
jgi:mercuric ion binding protein